MVTITGKIGKILFSKVATFGKLREKKVYSLFASILCLVALSGKCHSNFLFYKAVPTIFMEPVHLLRYTFSIQFPFRNN